MIFISFHFVSQFTVDTENGARLFLANAFSVPEKSKKKIDAQNPVPGNGFTKVHLSINNSI